jgi:hypothetical protein
LISGTNAKTDLRYRRGIEYQECWREGYMFQEIQDRLLSVGREKDTLEKNKKTLMKRLKMGTSFLIIGHKLRSS